MQAFYDLHNVALLQTEADGNCGPDTACIMLGLQRSQESRRTLREDVAAYILDRYNERWMMDLMVATQEHRGVL